MPLIQPAGSGCFVMTWYPSSPPSLPPSFSSLSDYDVRSAASILASVKEQEERFEQLTRALEEERRNVTLQLERANLPPNPAISQPLAWRRITVYSSPFEKDRQDNAVGESISVSDEITCVDSVTWNNTP
uniref:Uncharacterized protein n=1 Tax=Poecilia latipinna TaxID=48699 RepID=A0A3B3TN78_9TELE